MPRLLLLLTHQSYRAEAFLEAARASGLSVTVGTDREQALAFLDPVGNLTLDFETPEAAIERVQSFAREHPVDAVVAAEDDGVYLAARIAEALDLAGNPAEAVRAARDKQRARQAWRAAGLPGPRFEAFSLEDDPERVAALLAASKPADRRPAYPCVLKPLALSASRGVIRADDADGFVVAWRRLAAILGRPEIAGSGDPRARRILVEDYLPGVEIAVEGILEAGRLRPLAIFDKPDPLEGPFFEETIYVTPSRLGERDRVRALGMVERAALALGLRHGPVHAELRLDDSGARMLEIAPRSIGGLCGRSLRFVRAGESEEQRRSERLAASDLRMGEPPWISLESLILRHAIGQRVDDWRREPAASGVMMIPIPRAGILREVRGQDRARAVSGVEELRIGLALGSPVQPPPEGAQYLGFIFARGARAEDVERSLRDAHRALELQIDDRQGRGGRNP